MLCQAWDSFIFPEESNESDDAIVQKFCESLESDFKKPWKIIKQQLDLLLDQQVNKTANDQNLI